MKTLPKKVESKTKIRFQDCDPFNHLNNGSYINYFMNHREDILIKYYGMDIYNMAKNIGKSWVSNSNQIAYIKPALLMETIVIESQLIDFSVNSLKVEMKMYNENKTHLKAILWSGFTYFNLLEQRKETHDKKLMEFFGKIINPINASIFEERLQALRTEYNIKPLKAKC